MGIDKKWSKGLAQGLLFMGCTLVGASGMAQESPPIRLVVGYAAGGVTDAIARILAEGMRVELGRTVIVENRPGASGRIAAQAVINAPADGNTYLTGPDAWAIFPTLTTPPSELRYDVLNDFVGVARVVTFPAAWVVGERPGVSHFNDYIAWVKAHPQEALYGTAGARGKTEFLGSMVGNAIGVPMTVVPYKGNGPLAVDLLGGQVPAAVMVAGDALKLRNDKLHVLGVLTAERWAMAPEIPTLKELGYEVPGGMTSWQGVWARTGTPASQMAEVERALAKVLATPEVREKIQRDAFVMPDFATGEELQAQLKAELDFWRPIVEKAGYAPQ